MNKFLIAALSGILVLTMVGAFFFTRNEAEKNTLLRTENLKTASDAQAEIKKLKEEIKTEHAKNLENQQKLLEQITQVTKEKEKLSSDKEELNKRFSNEQKMSIVVNEDTNRLRTELDTLRKHDKEEISRLTESSKKTRQNYEARILSLEEQAAKAKSRVNSEAERYHYNLGVIYTQNKEFDSAVNEFKTALAFNPKNAKALYNLGIIFDDYFKDKENARYYYRSFLELDPTSDDAESVKEWLANLNK